ncbi:ATP-binding protein [Nocardia panacis]|uniref:ATP-binding protein n=1 Tax=Nocardia panacis TaxID=2340916 RepID=A0A3A4KRP4_9NOCA|nr:ATP-binding protein [Nocardia panacis]RJO78797.1 ATP-binding protein [Nocardia panacis]
MTDPFRTFALRAAVLAAWRDSPTRLREDAATEADLVAAGYRDRLLTELAQNAADAAAKAGVEGRVRVRLDGRELRIANTGAPLDISGVHALTALRASGKADPTAVGRFGVGFTAVLTVSDDVEIRSTTGGLRFSRSETRDALRECGIETFDGDPPVLRLAWPIDAGPDADADTEVVLRLRADIDAEALLAAMRAEAADLLLELPALRGIRIGDAEFTRTERELAHPALRESTITGPDDTRRTWWEYRAPRARWLLPIRAGRPIQAAPDVLRAPTRSDEELSLPALVIADIPMQPDRRRVLPGARLAELADGYADFAAALPARDRLVLVPTPGFARSEVDGLLREALITELRTHPWLPIVTPRAPDGVSAAPDRSDPALPDPDSGLLPDWDSAVGDSPVPLDDGLFAVPIMQSDGRTRESVTIPQRVSVFADLTEDLAIKLADMVGPLVIPELSGQAQVQALAVLDVHRLGLARIAEVSGGLTRAPQWWREFYAALEPYVVDPLSTEELGALAVPLADGRLVTGPRTVVLDDQLAEPIPVHWARLVHPDATHPLLARLGARAAAATDLLCDPALLAELEQQPDDDDLVDAVLRLAVYADPDALPDWLHLVELPDTAGDPRPADELLLPDAPLAALLVADAPFGTVSTAAVAGYGARALRAVGVGWDFGILIEDDPTGPDHDLDGERRWWSTLSEDPPRLSAVRDLDLIDDAAWPMALRRLLDEPRTRRLLADPVGYTPWWLRNYARIDGVALGRYRHPEDPEFAGLLPDFAVDGFGRADLDALRACLADPAAITPELADVLLEALADAAKTPAPETVSRVHARLAAAVDHLDLNELTLPDQVRALSGAVIAAADALVLDQPWFAFALPQDRLVVGEPATAQALATLLDLPLVSEAVTAEVVSTGRRTDWSIEPLGVVLRQLWALPPQQGELVLHHDLRVRLGGALEATVSVPWWRTETATHIRLGPPAQPR